MHVLRRRRRPDQALTLLRILCHELRPPVTTLSSLVEALEDDPPVSRRTELIRLAGAQAAHVQALLGRAATTALNLSDSPDPVQPLHRVLSGAMAGTPIGQLVVRTTPAALDWPVHARHTRQILTNLLTNAVRHGARDAPIEFRASVSGRRLRLRITNRGGFTGHLRQAFHQPTPPPGEKGLGLWIVRGLVTDLGGSIRPRRLGRDGVVVEVRLPRRR
jgi:signal transduction histidine kinase